MIRKFVYAKKPRLTSPAATVSHWTAQGDCVTVHYVDHGAVQLPSYHTPETLLGGKYRSSDSDSIVVESVEPWQAEVERLKGEIAIAEKKAAAYEALQCKPVGNLQGDAHQAELLGMKTGTGTHSADFLAFIKELIAERDAARTESERFHGANGSASAWKALNARGDLKGIQKPTCRDDILALVDQLKAKNSGVEEACKDLKAAIVDSLNRDGEAIPSADMILAGVRYINGLKKKLKSQCPTWCTLCETYGMPAIQGRSASDDIFNFVASLKAQVALSESSGRRITEALGFSEEVDIDTAVASIKGLQHSHDEFSSSWRAIVDLCRSQGMSGALAAESTQQAILRHIRNQESANGHLADEVNRLMAETKGPRKKVGWDVLTPVKNLHGVMKRRFNMPEDDGKNYYEDIIAFVEALKKDLDESHSEVSRLKGRVLGLAEDNQRLGEQYADRQYLNAIKDIITKANV